MSPCTIWDSFRLAANSVCSSSGSMHRDDVNGDTKANATFSRTTSTLMLARSTIEGSVKKRGRTCHRQNNRRQGQQVTYTAPDRMSRELIAEADSASDTDLLEDLNAAALAVAQDAASRAESVSAGYAVLVVKRGPITGSRFLLGPTVTSAGRHPDSDICLDDVTVSRRHSVRPPRPGGSGMV